MKNRNFNIFLVLLIVLLILLADNFSGERELKKGNRIIKIGEERGLYSIVYVDGNTSDTFALDYLTYNELDSVINK